MQVQMQTRTQMQMQMQVQMQMQMQMQMQTPPQWTQTRARLFCWSLQHVGACAGGSVAADCVTAAIAR